MTRKKTFYLRLSFEGARARQRKLYIQHLTNDIRKSRKFLISQKS